MIFENINKEYFNKGVFQFSNGNYIFIEDIQYSYDGSYWEDTFYPNEHVDPRNPTSTIKGHKYRRVRHAGDDYFQMAEYIVAEDGKTPVFTLMGDGLYWKYIDDADASYTLLVSLDAITGPKGEQGDDGRGWNIDSSGYYLEKPDCSSGLTSTSSCTSCSGGSSSSSTAAIYTFLSLGDGLYEIAGGDVGNYYSSDGSTWIEIVASDVGKLVRYTATDALGTGSVDYRTQDTLSTRGKVYYCDGENWNLLFNVAVPLYKVAPTEAYYTASQSGFYMEDYVSTPLSANYIADTIALTADYKLVVKRNSLEPAHFKDGSFGDGFNEGAVDATEGIKMSTIVVAPDDFVGFGLRSYVSATDTYLDEQVYAPDLVGDGLDAYDDSAHQADGETRYLFQVDPSELVDTTQSGLETFANTDGFLDLRVLIKAGLEITTTGLQPLVDDSSIELDAVTNELQVKDLGIKASHLNADTEWSAHGIEVDNINGIGISLAATSSGLGFDAGTGGLEIASHAVEGLHLSHNVADTSKGIKMDETTDLLEVLVKSGGGLTFDAGELAIDTGSLTWLNTAVVKKIEVWDYQGHSNLGDFNGDLVIQGDISSDTYMAIKLAVSGQSITVKPETNLSNLQSLIDTRVASALSSPPTLTESDITDLKDYVILDTQYLRTQMATGSGLHITSSGGNTYRLDVDDSGNLFTTLIP